MILVIAPAMAQTQDKDESGPAPAGGIGPYLSRTVKISGSLRMRWESGQGSDFRTTCAPWYLLTRARLQAAFQPEPWLKIAAEAQDSRTEFYRQKPSGSVADPVDLRQAYVQLGASENGVMARVGRQELTLGSGRLIASVDWSNTARLFDVARAQFNKGPAKIDLAAGSIVQIDPDRMDRHKPGEHFYAAFTSFSKLLPRGSVEPYFIYKTQMGVKSKDGLAGDAETYALGGRITGVTPFGVDYSVEGVRELGSYSSDRLNGVGFVGGVGYKLPGYPGKPRVSADWVYGSGDNGRKDHHRETLDHMYGFNQPTNSMTGQFCWRNLSELRVGGEFRPTAKLKATVDFRDFRVANIQDGVYNASGVRTVFNPKATSSHVGFGPDLQMSFAVRPTTTVGLGLGTLFPGEYLRQSGKTTGYLYPSVYVSRKF